MLMRRKVGVVLWNRPMEVQLYAPLLEYKKFWEWRMAHAGEREK